jgi:hypothetical protein
MSLVKDLRQMLMQSFLSLPLIIIGWIFFMGATQGNIAYMILSLGHMFVVPLLVLISNTVVEFLPKLYESARVAAGYMPSPPSPPSPFLTVPAADICTLLPGPADPSMPFVWVAPSYWMAHIIFFASFLVSNAITIYTMPAAEGADKEKVERRKTQVIISLALTALVFVSSIVGRYYFTKCETLLGITIGLVLFGGLGAGWYQLVRSCSAKDSDIFGIIQGIKPELMKDDPPMTCVYQG